MRRPWRTLRDLAPADRVHRAGRGVLYYLAGDRGDSAENGDPARGGPAGSRRLGRVCPGSRGHPRREASAPVSLRNPRMRRTWIVRSLLIGFLLGLVGFALAQSVP